MELRSFVKRRLYSLRQIGGPIITVAQTGASHGFSICVIEPAEEILARRLQSHTLQRPPILLVHSKTLSHHAEACMVWFGQQ
jgi:hypothetical protein